MKNKLFLLPVFIVQLFCSNLNAQEAVFPGADENTTSKAQYFSWINNTNEGTNEAQTLVNLDFFKWLKEGFGMQLDIYAFDAGAIDGKRFYGSTKSARFKSQFPSGFDPVYKKAKNSGIRLGIWGGPDGFGDSPAEEKERIAQMVGLCKDYNFALFKFDAVCGPLREDKEDAFITMMKECRKYSPDLILLNHRLGLKKSLPYATTFLWGGDETYIDVFMSNQTTAPHHRAAALSRGLIPDLKRLTEDHGVCISSCLDNWDDDLILQSFSRSLILSPEIYGNPWLLQDSEFPKLARIYNIQKKYNRLLTNGIILPESKYGPHAVSRGDAKTRIIALKNLSWNKASYDISLNAEIGISNGEKITVIQLHPEENLLGYFKYNDVVKVSVEPYRAALFIVTTEKYDDPLIEGVPFNVVRNVLGESVLIDLMGASGTSAQVKLSDFNSYKSVKINEISSKGLLNGKSASINFKGAKLKLDTHRKLTDFKEIAIPEEAEALYEATVFSADNNALEVRSLQRSGETNIPEVQKAREAFFNQKTFIERSIWDKNLFDSDLKTGFVKTKKYNIDQSIKGGTFRLDLGEVIQIDELKMFIPDDFSLQPLLSEEGNFVEVSTDLNNWETITYMARTESVIPIHKAIRYLRFREQPQQIVEIEGYRNGKMLDRSKWRASNLFAHGKSMKCVKAWKSEFSLPEIAKNSYLSVALNGKHGVEGAYVAAKIDGKLIGAPDRAVSYTSNTWEYVNERSDSNYTYYIPLQADQVNKKIEVFVLGYDKENGSITPEVWISSKDAKEKIRVELIRK